MRSEDRSDAGSHTGSGLKSISPVEHISCADWLTFTSSIKTENVKSVSAMFSNPTAGHRNRQQKANSVGPI